MWITIIVGCADDPGVEEIREALPESRLPQAVRTTLALARKYGEKFGFGITPDYAPKLMQSLIPASLTGRPDGVYSTLDLMTPQGQESYSKYGKKN